MPIAVIILLIVFLAIAFRKMTPLHFPIWSITTLGAIAALLFQQITPLNAIAAIEPDVMLYLAGVFLISQAAEESGYLEQLTDQIFYYARTGREALVIITFLLGLAAAFLMNDTLAIVGTPIILQLCKSHKNLVRPLLFALAFSVTIGSTVSPIGNPQNLLIAVKGEMVSPFLEFIKPLAIPTLINLTITYFYIYFIYKSVLNETIEKPIPSPIHHYRTILLVKISLSMMVMLVIAKIVTDFMHTSLRINFSYIAILSALPILFSNQRWILIKRLDWGTLLFFASTFVLVQSVWDSGFFQDNIHYFHLPVTQILTILVISLILSQFISNVPLVALYLPLLIHQHLSDSRLLALAVGSTIAGNLSILGAASNIIIIQGAEKRKDKGFGFFEFIKIGAPLTIINVLTYAFFLWVGV